MAYYVFDDGEAVELNEHEPVNGRKVSKKVYLEARAAYYRNELLKLLNPGDTVYTVAHGNTGSQHKVLIPVTRDGKPTIRDITHLVAEAAGFRRNRDGTAIQQGGGGYSKSFHIVYGLGSCLWPHGTPEPHGTRNGAPDTSGGYALKHDWL